MALGQNIYNPTAPPRRRPQLDFTIDYQDDVDRALELLLACAAAEPRVAPKPAPWAKLTALNERGATVSLRVWSSPKDLEDTQYDLLKTVKEHFEDDGFSLPYPHQVSVKARPFQPRTSRAPARAAAPKRLPAPAAEPASRGSSSPRPTRADSSQGR
jgi:small conductance mechanosensitive channel